MVGPGGALDPTQPRRCDMTIHMRVFAAVLLLGGALAMLPASDATAAGSSSSTSNAASQADQRNIERGKQAIEAGDWERAAAFLERAAESNAQQRGRLQPARLQLSPSRPARRRVRELWAGARPRPEAPRRPRIHRRGLSDRRRSGQGRGAPRDPAGHLRLLRRDRGAGGGHRAVQGRRRGAVGWADVPRVGEWRALDGRRRAPKNRLPDRGLT